MQQSPKVLLNEIGRLNNELSGTREALAEAEVKIATLRDSRFRELVDNDTITESTEPPPLDCIRVATAEYGVPHLQDIFFDPLVGDQSRRRQSPRKKKKRHKPSVRSVPMFEQVPQYAYNITNNLLRDLHHKDREEIITEIMRRMSWGTPLPPPSMMQSTTSIPVPLAQPSSTERQQQPVFTQGFSSPGRLRPIKVIIDTNNNS